MVRRQRIFCAALLAVSLFASPVVVGARDYFLTIGGGYNPAANQASLERNVLLQGELLDKIKPNSRRDVFFSDGNSPGRDVQYKDPAFVTPRVNQLLARLFRGERNHGYRYRSHQIEEVRGEASRENLKRWFTEVGARLKKNDRLFLYVTTHGGAGEGATPHDTSIFLWNGQKLRMTELVSHLDQVSVDVHVTVVMVQCYAGGFANLIYNDGVADKGFSAANRSGFFATVRNRPAAGCSVDVRGDEHQEYSRFFWAALQGEFVTGEAIVAPDYDGNGAITFDEAHTYAVLVSDTIDIPVKTSDLLLRQHSRNYDDLYPELYSTGTAYEQLLSLATINERVLIDGLSSQLGLAGTDRGREATELAKRMLIERRRVDNARTKLIAKYGRVCKQIQQQLLLTWPELYNRWNPQVTEYLTLQSSAIIDAIESHDRYTDFIDLHDQITQLSETRLTLDRRWAKSQRLLRTIENVILAANLPSIASPDVLRQYERLLRAEHQTLIGPMARQGMAIQ